MMELLNRVDHHVAIRRLPLLGLLGLPLSIAQSAN